MKRVEAALGLWLLIALATALAPVRSKAWTEALVASEDDAPGLYTFNVGDEMTFQEPPSLLTISSASAAASIMVAFTVFEWDGEVHVSYNDGDGTLNQQTFNSKASATFMASSVNLTFNTMALGGEFAFLFTSNTNFNPDTYCPSSCVSCTVSTECECPYGYSGWGCHNDDAAKLSGLQSKFDSLLWTQDMIHSYCDLESDNCNKFGRVCKLDLLNIILGDDVSDLVLPKHLESLSVDGGNIDPSLLVMSKANNLKQLTLTDLGISSIGPNLVANLTALNEITLSHNPLDSSVYASLSEIATLKQTRMENCSLGSVDFGILQNLNDLKSIELAGNNLTSILNSNPSERVNVFWNLLDLSHCNIRDIDMRVIPNVIRVNLNDNSLTDVTITEGQLNDSEVFVSELWLENNELEEFPCFERSSVTVRFEVRLANNPTLSKHSRVCPNAFPFVTILDASNCSLTLLPSNFKEFFPSLARLDVSKNNFDTFPSTWTSGLELALLDVSDCGIQRLSLFNSWQNADCTLVMADNPLVSFELVDTGASFDTVGLSFQGSLHFVNVSVSTIDVLDFSLSRFENDAVLSVHASTIGELRMMNCDLEETTLDTSSVISGAINKVRLTGSKLTNFPNWLQATGVNVLDISCNGLFSTADIIQFSPALIHLNASYNNLIDDPIPYLTQLPELIAADFSFNNFQHSMGIRLDDPLVQAFNPTVQTLDLSGNTFVKGIPFGFKPLGAVSNFTCNRCSLQYQQFDKFQQWTSLTWLSLRETTIMTSDQIILMPPSLIHVDVSGSSVPGLSMAQLNLPVLETLLASDCHLQQVFPANFSDLMPSIKEIDVSFNNLLGQVPHSVPHTLVRLNLSHNSLAGWLPEWYYGATRLEVDVSDNDLLMCDDENMNFVSVTPCLQFEVNSAWLTLYAGAKSYAMWVGEVNYVDKAYALQCVHLELNQTSVATWTPEGYLECEVPQEAGVLSSLQLTSLVTKRPVTPSQSLLDAFLTSDVESGKLCERGFYWADYSRIPIEQWRDFRTGHTVFAELVNSTLECKACPENTLCGGGNHYPIPQPGSMLYQDSEGSVQMSICRSISQCPGGEAGVSQCGGHFTGKGCVECEAGYAHEGAQCVFCGEGPRGEAAGAYRAAVVVVVVGMSLVGSKWGFYFGGTRLLLLFVQLIGLLDPYALEHNVAVDALLQKCYRLFVFLEVPGIACALEADPMARIHFMMQLPLFVAVVLAAVLAVPSLTDSFRGRKPFRDSLRLLLDQWTNSFLLFLVVWHPALARAPLSGLQCDDLGRLHDAPEMRCSDIHNQVLLIFFAAVHTVCMPTVMAALAYKEFAHCSPRFLARTKATFRITRPSLSIFHGYRMVFVSLLAALPTLIPNMANRSAGLSLVLLFLIDLAVNLVCRPFNFPALHNVWSAALVFVCVMVVFGTNLSGNSPDGDSGKLMVLVIISFALALCVLLYGLVYELKHTLYIHLRPGMKRFFDTRFMRVIMPAHLQNEKQVQEFHRSEEESHTAELTSTTVTNLII
jgi:Leucine-rich repeat (LRR) protein